MFTLSALFMFKELKNWQLTKQNQQNDEGTKKSINKEIEIMKKNHTNILEL